jgi:hypothetical protein
MTPTIPIGLATKAGLSGAVGLFVAALVATISDQTPEAIGALAAATLSLLTVLGGRYAQAAAAAGKAIDAAAADADASHAPPGMPSDVDTSPLEAADGDLETPPADVEGV